MAKHFEDLWQEAEQVMASPPAEEKLTLKLLAQDLNYWSKLDANGKALLMGELLLKLASLSAKENINVYAALQEAITNHQIDELEDEE